MGQLNNLFSSLSSKQRLTIYVVVTLAIVAGTLVLRSDLSQNFKPLYTSLSPEDAAAVVEKLKGVDFEYRLADNGETILVPAAHVAEMRLEMALAGLPKTGRIGFELFDRTNLGVTEFAEHINYQRALEGEIERSVMSLTEVERARVHITFPKETIFLESQRPAKASVLLELRPGSQIAPRSVTAITHLIASAVEGLEPEAVSVLDMRGNLLSRPRAGGGLDGPEASEALLDYQQSMERNLLKKINSTLDPLLGNGRFRAGLSVECDFSSGEESEESYDPSQSVMVNSQRSEEVSSRGSAGGVPGTASTLPNPQPSPPVTSGLTRRTENISYQTARTVRHTTIPRGSLKRISASVLVDHAVRWEGEGENKTRIVEPQSAEKLEKIRALVAAAIGLVPSRGDELIVQNLPFESTSQYEPMDEFAAPMAPLPTLEQQLLDRLKSNPTLVIGVGVGALLLLVMMLLVIRSRGRRHDVSVENVRRAIAAASPPKLEAPGGSSGAVQGEPAAGIPAPRQSIAPELIDPVQNETLLGEVRSVVQNDTGLSRTIVRDWIVDGGQT